MAVWDSISVGDPVIAESHFGDGFRDDFDSLDIETSSTPGNRTGKWKKGFIHANMAQNGFTYGSDEGNRAGDNFVHAAINYETAVYDDTRKPNPSGWSPFSVSGGVLTITSRPVDAGDAAEYEWARVKTPLVDASGNYVGDSYDARAKYVSGMLSTYGRFALSFGRFRARVKTPYGADGSSSDIRQNSAIFPAALWSLQDIPYDADINGEPLASANTTYRPARPNGGGILHEIDGDENFGESATSIHQTVHAHPAGTAQGSSDSDPLTIPIGKNLRSEWRESGYDVFPDRIAFFVDGVYTHVVSTTDEIQNGLPLYAVDSAEPYNPVMTSANTAEVVGRQQHPDGSTRYMRHVLICNLARDGLYPRQLARQIVQAGNSLPAHADTVSVEIDYIEARPLLTDNPDTLPMSINGVATAADGSTAGTGTETGTASLPGYTPTLGFGIRHRQGATSGEIVYYLENPEAVGPGTWIIDEYGDDATVLSDDLRGDSVRLLLPSVSTTTPRLIRFAPD